MGRDRKFKFVDGDVVSAPNVASVFEPFVVKYAVRCALSAGSVLSYRSQFSEFVGKSPHILSFAHRLMSMYVGSAY